MMLINRLGRWGRTGITAGAALLLFVPVVGFAAASLPPGGSFSDDDGNIHEAAIEAIAAEGITKGCNPPINDLYCPSATVTRGQMAAFLVRALDLPSTADAPFSDAAGVFEDSINRLAAAGITRGCNPPTNTLFCPDSAVTRGQMAAFLVRALDLPSTTDAPFSDAAGVFEDSINRLAAAGITKGCNPPTNDLFCPDSPVKRDQMASFLTRALDLTPITPPPPTTSTTSGGTTGTTLPAVLPPVVFRGCDTGVTGEEFSLEQECVEGVAHSPLNFFSSKSYWFYWRGPDGQPVDHGCPATGPCTALIPDTEDGHFVGYTALFWVAAENRAPGWYALEIWSGEFSYPQVLDSRTSFLLSAIPPTPTTTTTTAPTTTTTTMPTLPNVSWECTVNPDGSRDCSGNTDTLDPAVETWTCTPSGDPLARDPVSWACSGDIDKRPSGSGVETWACDAELGDSTCAGNVDTSDSADESWSVVQGGFDTDTYFDAEGNIDKSDSEVESWGCVDYGTGLLSCYDSGYPPDPWEWTCSGAFGSDWSCSGTVGRLAPIVGPIPTQDSAYNWW